MATAKSKKTALKKVAKKAAAPAKPKRKYVRKAKAPVLETSFTTPVNTEQQAEACSASLPPRSVDFDRLNLLDLRGLPLGVKAMFLLELESQGYVNADLKKPSESNMLHPVALGTLEVIKFNQLNKILTFRAYKQLKQEDGIIAVPTSFVAGVHLRDIECKFAAPDSLEVDGVQYTKVG